MRADEEARALPEYWLPPNAWEPKVGDLVWAAISPECVCHEIRWKDILAGGVDFVTRRPGVVQWIGLARAEPTFNGHMRQTHQYVVIWDCPVVVPVVGRPITRLTGAFYARWELSPRRVDG